MKNNTINTTKNRSTESEVRRISAHNNNCNVHPPAAPRIYKLEVAPLQQYGQKFNNITTTIINNLK